MIFYALTIFWSAFLLFLVQPILGKQILPWFGGTPAVWTTCLLFFQVLLLGGYIYAHGLNAWLKPKAQAVVHFGLLAGSLWLLPIAADPAYRQEIKGSPTWQILALLTITVGGPYFLLSATGPLLQAWFAKTHARSPYRLYALSNVGSLLALLSYPFIVEPRLKLGQQTWNWSWGYGLFAAVCGVCAIQLFLRGEKENKTDSSELNTEGSAGRDAALIRQPSVATFSLGEKDALGPSGVAADASSAELPVPRGTKLYWLALSATGSALLLATTNQICQEVAVVPFLWILPLVLYLTSFIICFDSPRWYVRPIFMSLLVTFTILAALLIHYGVSSSIFAQLSVYLGSLFAGTMVCHGELVRSKPPARQLTLFYLLVAAGGAAGGLFVAVLAPVLFSGYWEYPLALWTSWLLAVVALARDPNTVFRRPETRWVWIVALLALMGLGSGMLYEVREYRDATLVTTRNFYGVLRVMNEDSPSGIWRVLQHGATRHGAQLLDPALQRLPAGYYDEKSGIGYAILRHPRRAAQTTEPDAPPGPGMKIGVIGLGAGTIAAYGRPQDVIRFYEINPEVERISRNFFTYRANCPAQVDVGLGDARLVLADELAASGSQAFDVLVVDAFSSDAIPMHLVTRECNEIYWAHLKPDGILAVHVSNRNIDLIPVVHALGREVGKTTMLFESDDFPHGGSPGALASEWVLVTSNQAFLEDAQIVERLGEHGRVVTDDEPTVLWTDEYGSLWQVLKRR